MLYRVIQVPLNERAVVLENGLPIRALGPGKHRLWGRGLSVQRLDVDQLLVNARPEVRAVLPREWLREIELSSSERAVLYVAGHARLYLRPGVYHYWLIDPSTRVVVWSVEGEFPELTEALEHVIPKTEYVSTLVGTQERGLEKVRGRLTRVLEPGLYRSWKTPSTPCTVEVVDMRRSELAIVGQELMTRDKVSLRLSLSVEYAVSDVELSTRVASVRDAVYVAAQLAARDYVAGVTLDALLEGRDAMTQALSATVIPEAQAIGVRVERVGVKDVVLPGEMKTLLNRVIEAEKEAQANVILRREETAATRSLANTARVMAQEPILLRLKELEAMKEIASSIKEVRVVVGADGLSSLLPAQLLGETPKLS